MKRREERYYHTHIKGRIGRAGKGAIHNRKVRYGDGARGGGKETDTIQIRESVCVRMSVW